MSPSAERSGLRIVLDTNALVSATLWKGSVAQKLLARLVLSNAVVFTSEDILREYEEVLFRDFHYQTAEIAFKTSKILSFASLTPPVVKVDVIKEDPDDNRILECAIAARAHYVITYDKHLLKLKWFQETTIVKPEELLARIA